MLWTFFSGVHLTLCRAISALNHDPHSNLVDLQSTTDAFQCIAAGAVFTGTVVLVKARVQQGGPLLRQPGHCLVLIGAISHLLMLPATLLRGVERTYPYNDEVVALLVLGAIELGLAMAYVAALWSGWELRWKRSFGVLAGLNSLQGTYYLLLCLLLCLFLYWDLFWYHDFFAYVFWLLPLASGGLLLMGIWIVIVSIVDVKGGERRDWLHWFGVLSYVMSSFLNVTWVIVRFIIGEIF